MVISTVSLDPGFKQVPLTAETSSPDFKLVPIDAQVIDSTQKAVPADAIVVSVDVPENTTLESNEIQVESDDIQQPDTTNELRLLSANEIAVPADSVIVGPDQIAVPADSVVLSPDQIAVSADAEILEEGQRAIPEQKVDVDTEFTDSTAGDSQSTGDYQQPPSISSPRATGVDASGTSEMTSMKLGDDAFGVGSVMAMVMAPAVPISQVWPIDV